MSFFEFIPHIPTVQPPRQMSGMGGGRSAEPLQSVLHPIARVLDLGDIPVSGVRDYFLYHPYDGNLENIYLSAPESVTLSDFSIQIIQKQGNTIVVQSEEKRVGDVGTDAQSLIVPSSFGEGAVFARVRSAAVAGQNLFLTLHVRTNEIQ